MSFAIDGSLAGDALARRITELRTELVRRHKARNPSLAYEEVDDVYGQVVVALLEREPPPSFGTEWELRAWLNESVRRGLLHYGRSSATRLEHESGRLEVDAIEPVATDFTPEQHLLMSEQQAALTEYIAGLRPEDRRIALLWLWPSSRLKARAISAVLGVPLSDVRGSIHRVRTDFGRYQSLSAAGVCRKQMRHLDRWRHDGGELPLQLTLHSRRCALCRAQVQQARATGYDALLPLVPGVALPVLGGGVIANVLAGAKHLVPTTKQGAGTTLLASKGSAMAAVTAATVAAGVAGTVVVTHDSQHQHRRHSPIPTLVQTTTTPASTTPQSTLTSPAAAPAPTATTVSTTATATTDTSTTTGQTSTPADAAPDEAQGSANDPAPGSSAHASGQNATSFTSNGSGGSSTALSPTGKTPSAP